MARTFEEFPVTREDVDLISFPYLVEMIVEMTDPEAKFVGTAGMSINSFLAHAAVRMARAIYKTPTGGIAHELTELDRCVRQNIEIG